MNYIEAQEKLVEHLNTRKPDGEIAEIMAKCLQALNDCLEMGLDGISEDESATNTHLFCITENDVDTALDNIKETEGITLTPEQRQKVIEDIKHWDFSFYAETIEDTAIRFSKGERYCESNY